MSPPAAAETIGGASRRLIAHDPVPSPGGAPRRKNASNTLWLPGEGVVFFEREIVMTMRGIMVALAALAAACLGLKAPAVLAGDGGPRDGGREEVVSSIGAYAYPLDVAGTRMLLPFASNQPVDRAAPVRELVLTIHGMHRHVNLTRSQWQSLSVAGRPDTLVFLPQFLKDRDRAAHGLTDDVLSWRGSWQWGDQSSGPRPISSFEIMDRLILQLLAQYPTIASVVVMGNSAGGQFTQRYAELSAVQDIANAGGKRVAFRYLAANPSSYLYVDNRRVLPSGHIEVPPAAALTLCPGYNSYGYGLDGANPYAGRSSVADIAGRMLRRNVTYFIGDDDNDENHPELDRHCSAEIQGAERFERSRNYWRYLVAAFGPQVQANQRQICIPRGTHDFRTIWGTPCGASLIGGTGACAPAPCPA
jgi:pimeloyl-ACP methyl ester carboxylesterase